MKPFNDNEGRQYELSVEPFRCRRVRDLTGIDLLTMMREVSALAGAATPDSVEESRKQVQALMSPLCDPYDLPNVLYVLLEDQVTAYGLDDYQFGASLTEAADGRDPLDDAADALLDELLNFFLRPLRRAARTALTQTRDEMRRAGATIEQAVNVAIETGELLATSGS